MASKSTPPLTAPAQPGDAKAPPARKPGQRADWEAIERDFRTGRFTQVELAAKHQVNPATLCRKIKADQAIDPTRWQPDLTEAVRQATNASLMMESIKDTLKAGQVSGVVLAAAEVNKQVILAHRTRVAAVNADADRARERLVSLLDTAEDIKGAAMMVAALESAARTVKTLVEVERRAYGLGDGDDTQTPATPPPDGSVDPAEAYRWLCQQRA